MTVVIEVDDLFKSYGALNAVRGISFEVSEGEVFAMLGSNGAGKTTTLEILEGHRRRSGGRVEVLGVDPGSGDRRLRDRIGIVLQSAGLDDQLTVHETLSLYAGFYARPLAVGDVTALVGLDDKAHSRVESLSGGQRRRLDLALALVGDPDLVFLDEPTTGLDPAARRATWQLVRDLSGLGRTIVLTSHYMDEVAHLADRAIVLAAGRIVAEGPPGSLDHRQHQATISFRLGAGAFDLLPAGLREQAVRDRDEVTIHALDPTRTLLALCDWSVACSIPLDGLQVTRPSLEDVYLEMTEQANDGRR